MNKTISCLEAALAYAKAGYFIFPAKAGEKKSRLSKQYSWDGRNWGMSNNPDTIRKNWGYFTDESNVCIVTGEINSLFVVETDTAAHGKDGEGELRKLIDANNGVWPDTMRARSPSGSIHYYFKWPDGNHLIRNSDNKLAPGVDVRGDGGMVIAPPSLNPKYDARYEWLSKPGVSPADAPAWLLALVIEQPIDKHTGEPLADISKIAAAMENIPNEPDTTWEVVDRKDGGIVTRVGWDGWNDIMMALFRATGGTDEGFKIADKWCAKNKVKYEPKYTSYSWYRRYRRSPPRTLGAGTLFVIADEYVPGWRAVWEEEHREDIKVDKKAKSEARIEEAKKTHKYEIRLTAGDNNNIYETEEMLVTAGVQFYVFGRTLVRPILMPVRAMEDQITNVAHLIDVEPKYMQLVANEKITYLKYDARAKKWNSVDPPMKIIDGLMVKVGEWKFPIIAGVISTPTLRYDGTLFDRAGYDPKTRFLMIDPPKMPTMREKPTRGDALEAIELLEELLSEFCFIDEVAKAVALSAMITPIVRGAFQAAPMHVNKAPTPASGKSYLFDVVAAIAIGQRMPTTAAGKDTEETEKRLGASLLAGQPLINIDNVNGELGGDALCQYIERPMVNVRVLGKSENRTVETGGTTIYCTGNNVTLVGDITRRSLICTLDPNVERPELRVFKKDPLRTVLKDRGKYIAACLTICRAFQQSGAKPVKRLGSFEGWSDLVRSALVWLGKADPVLSMDLARADDPVLLNLDAILTQWARVIGTGEASAVTLAHALELASESAGSGYDKYNLKYPDFYEAVCRVASVFGRPPDLKRFGYWARSIRGRPVNDMKLINRIGEKKGGTARWYVVSGESKDSTGLKDQPDNVINFTERKGEPPKV